MVHIENGTEPGTVKLVVTTEELRTLVHRLAPEDSFLRHRAEGLLPEDHEQIADDLSEKLRRFHDKSMRRGPDRRQ